MKSKDIINIKVLSDSDLDDPAMPDYCKVVPPLKVMSISSKTVMNYKTNVTEIVCLSFLVYNTGRFHLIFSSSRNGYIWWRFEKCLSLRSCKTIKWFCFPNELWKLHSTGKFKDWISKEWRWIIKLLFGYILFSI